jgi:hypothetical protein
VLQCILLVGQSDVANVIKFRWRSCKKIEAEGYNGGIACSHTMGSGTSEIPGKPKHFENLRIADSKNMKSSSRKPCLQIPAMSTFFCSGNAGVVCPCHHV